MTEEQFDLAHWLVAQLRVDSIRCSTWPNKVTGDPTSMLSQQT